MASTPKKITRVEGSDQQGSSDSRTFKPTDESKSKATTFRIIAIACWLVGFGFGIWVFFSLKENPINMTKIIILLVADLIFVIIGSQLWKKANRFDPASEKDKFRFFVQNQLGLIISVIAFLPLVILIFTNKNMSGKQKGILGTIAIAALAIAGLTGTDFNPPSQEKYAAEIEKVKELNGGVDFVYWTKSGKSYHLHQDCSYINSNRTTEIFEGSVAQAKELKSITDLCDRCERKSRLAIESQETTSDVETEETVDTVETEN